MILYILLRLFVHKRHYYLEGDELRHLTTAKNFYKLWNKSFYDMHPPFYSWLIRVFHSGRLVSLLCSIGLYLVCSRLYDVLGLNPYQKSIALLFLTFNYTLIYYSNRMFRYQLIALLGTLMLYLLLTHRFFAAGWVWGLLSLTCSFAGLRAFWIWLMLGHPISLVGFLFCYGSWLWSKAKVYIANDYYPSGVEGKIEPVFDFTWKQLLSPLYFPWTYAYYGKKELGYDFKGWFKRIGGVFGLYQTRNNLLNKLIGVLTVTLAGTAILGALKSSPWIVLLTLLLLYPSLYKRFLPRNSIIAIPILGFFLAKGFPLVPFEWLLWGEIGLLVGFLALNRTFFLTDPKIKAKITSRYLRHLPKDGLLVEGLIAYPIVYQTDKRVVCIPHDPNKEKALDQVYLSIHEFSLNYAVVSELWKTEAHLGYPAIEFIKQFKHIKTIEEDGDRYYVYALFAD